jgi:hypothetical protein
MKTVNTLCGQNAKFFNVILDMCRKQRDVKDRLLTHQLSIGTEENHTKPRSTKIGVSSAFIAQCLVITGVNSACVIHCTWTTSCYILRSTGLQSASYFCLVVCQSQAFLLPVSQHNRRPGFFFCEGPRSRCYGRTAVFRLIVKAYDEDD